MFDHYYCIIQLFHAKIWRNCPDFAKIQEPKVAWKNDISQRRFKNAAFGANFNVIMTSPYNVKCMLRDDVNFYDKPCNKHK